MKLGGQSLERFLRRPLPEVVAVLVYGPDEGLVRERVERVIATVLDDAGDPFRTAELGPDAIRAEPGRLLDEARALSLIGGRRVVRVRRAGDQLSAACRSLLALETVEALVVVDAGELGASSSLRRLFEGDGRAAAIACYRDEGRDLESAVDRLLAERGLVPEPEARTHLIEHLGVDRAITRSELDKLALYLDHPNEDTAGGEKSRRVSLAAAAAVVGDSAALTIDDLVHAATLGEAAALERGLDRLFGQGESPVRLVRALAQHLGRLQPLALRIERGESVERAMGAARPPIHFRRKDAVRAALGAWRAADLARAQGQVIDAEIGCKTTGRPAELLVRRLLLATCRRAAAAAAAAGRAGPGQRMAMGGRR